MVSIRPRIGRRCRICRRPGPRLRRRVDWLGRCSACAAYFRRTGRERPFIVSGRTEQRGQRVLRFVRDLPTR